MGGAFDNEGVCDMFLVISVWTFLVSRSEFRWWRWFRGGQHFLLLCRLFHFLIFLGEKVSP